jgi:antitoxin component of RelBE/YafQ-DinJ toxin-antitoxin module
MAADGFMHIRVPSEMKAFARTLAARGGITESRLIKQLLETLLRTKSLSGHTGVPARDTVRRQARLDARLHPEDRRLLSDRSNGRGMASATYAALRVRAHLRGAAPLPKSEYLALRQSILELAAVGRNLNQIVQAMNCARGVSGCQ